jgi:hypothetical protein
MQFLKSANSKISSFLALLISAYFFDCQFLFSFAYPVFYTLDAFQTYPQFSPNSPFIPSVQKRETVTGDTAVPGVDDCAKQVDMSQFPNAPPVFYTGYPLQLKDAKQWAICYFEEDLLKDGEFKFWIWDRIATGWYINTIEDLDEDMEQKEFP